MRPPSLLVCLCIFLASCFDAGKLPKGILPKESMRAVLWDVMKANAYTNTYLANDPTRNAQLENARMQLQIFALHHTTKEEFYRSFVYYTSHIEVMHPMIISLTLRAQNEKVSMPSTPGSDTRVLNTLHEKDIP